MKRGFSNQSPRALLPMSSIKIKRNEPVSLPVPSVPPTLPVPPPTLPVPSVPPVPPVPPTPRPAPPSEGESSLRDLNMYGNPRPLKWKNKLIYNYVVTSVPFSANIEKLVWESLRKKINVTELIKDQVLNILKSNGFIFGDDINVRIIDGEVVLGFYFKKDSNVKDRENTVNKAKKLLYSFGYMLVPMGENPTKNFL